jgi:hypothetical protein
MVLNRLYSVNFLSVAQQNNNNSAHGELVEPLERIDPHEDGAKRFERLELAVAVTGVFVLRARVRRARVEELKRVEAIK